MKAIILAAGRGSRMKDLTESKPKCLVSVHGRPLIEWQLNALRRKEITSIGIVTGYRREMLEKYKLTEFINKDWASTQMFSSLSCAHRWLEEDTCIISYSDIFYEPEAINLLIESNSNLAITYDPNWHEIWSKRFSDPLLDAETFRLSSSSCLLEIGKKTSSTLDIEGQYMGLLRITPDGWKEIESVLKSLRKTERDKIQLTTVLQTLIEKASYKIEAIPYLGGWGEVDSASDISTYELEADGQAPFIKSKD